MEIVENNCSLSSKQKRYITSLVSASNKEVKTVLKAKDITYKDKEENLQKIKQDMANHLKVYLDLCLSPKTGISFSSRDENNIILLQNQKILIDHQINQNSIKVLEEIIQQNLKENNSRMFVWIKNMSNEIQAKHGDQYHYVWKKFMDMCIAQIKTFSQSFLSQEKVKKLFAVRDEITITFPTSNIVKSDELSEQLDALLLSFTKRTYAKKPRT